MSEVVVERHGAVQVCRLNRPQERNGLTGVLLASIWPRWRRPVPTRRCGWSSRPVKAMRSSAGGR